jgi:RNA polymerase sporulation-specific sigma factor
MKCDDEFVNSNIGLVKSIAKRFCGRGTEFEDLVQIGCIGLIKAGEKFDENLGYKFSTYAVPVIMGEIKKHIRDNNYIKISRKIKENLLKINYTRDTFIKKNGKEPQIEEISNETGLSVEEINECMESNFIVSSFDNVLGDMLFDDDKEEEVLDKIFLSDIISRLDKRSREIMCLRYFENKTQQEISEVIGVSQVQISRLEKKILKIMKDMCI